MQPKARESMEMWDGTLYEVQYMGLRDTGAFIFRFRITTEKGPNKYVSDWVTVTRTNHNDMNSLHDSLNRRAWAIETKEKHGPDAKVE